MSQLNFLDGEEHSASPIRRQYLDIKRRYPDAILLFRLGDFYETFDEDAYLVSSELEIALTGRDMGRGERVPLAGIPCHAAEGYIARLLAKGHKIALAEQLGTPGRGLMAREVVRVITPGTLIEDSLLPARANNYLASVVPSREGAGLSLVDISTGEFAVTEIGADGWRIQLAAELERTRPAEILLPRSCGEDPTLAAVLPSGSCVTLREDSTFSSSTCERLLRDLFGVATLDGFGIGSNSLAARAAGSLISYLQETQPASLSQLENLHSYSLDRYMKLDPAARRHLELTANASTGGVEGSLLWVLDRTRTPMGGRLLRRWIGQPLLDLSAIEARLNSVEELVRAPLARAELADAMSGMGDLERLASRAAQQNLSPRDCLAMARSLRAVSWLRRTIERLLPALGDAESGGLDPCTEVAAAIESTVADDPSAQVGQGAIRQGRSRELDELRAISGDTRRWIASLERSERERTGIRTLKVGFNRVFGYYIEVTRASLEAPTDEYARMKTGAATVGEMLEALGYQRKQTLANAERFVTAQLKEQEMRLNSAQEEMEALEKQIYAELMAEISGMSPRIRKTAQAVARLDALLSLAEVAVAGRYVRPVVDEGASIVVRAGRHPMVERALPTGEYVPNDCELDSEGARIAIITGPNMAGKSTYILGVALIVLMAQIGSFVPADAARIGLVDRIFTRVGAQHDVAGGKSTFLVEMAETANVLRNATPRSLVVLDEIGRGTSTYDGLAIARAVIEHIHDEPGLRCKTLFATHYHELTELERVLPGVKNLRMDVLEEGDRVVFLHRVVPGGADRSYGIHVAQLAGVPEAVVRRARDLLELLEANGAGRVESSKGMDRVAAEQVMLVEELARLDVSRMTPIEAIAKLAELQKRAAEWL